MAPLPAKVSAGAPLRTLGKPGVGGVLAVSSSGTMSAGYPAGGGASISAIGSPNSVMSGGFAYGAAPQMSVGVAGQWQQQQQQQPPLRAVQQAANQSAWGSPVFDPFA